MKFYLGTHMPHWLTKPDAPPLFVSHRRLLKRRTMPRAATSWALDSGGFTELSMFGEWQTTPTEYIVAVRRYRTEIGRMDWAAPQDWMCEPWIVAKTGLTVAEHQRRTINNYIELRDTSPDLPFVPVLQGWTIDDYLRHVELYASHGVDLRHEAVVGLGSVCRRQATSEIAELVAAVASLGIQLHGFGVKGDGLRRYGWLLSSAELDELVGRGPPHQALSTHRRHIVRQLLPACRRLAAAGARWHSVSRADGARGHRVTTCPMCGEPADRECQPCGVRILRNKRGEADIVKARHPDDRRKWRTVWTRGQHAHMDDGGQRRAELHNPTRERQTSAPDPAEEYTTIDLHRVLGRFNFGRKRTA